MSSTGEDAQLLAQWRAGDQKAGETLIERNFPRVKRFFRRKTSNRDVVQELSQRTFIRCMDKIDAFEHRSSFSSFLYGIARNILLEHYREQRKADRGVSVEEVPAVDLEPSPFSIVERRSERKLIIHVLRRLPLDTQILIELYFFENLPGRQVSEVLELPEGTVRGRIRSCRGQVEKLVRQLAESPEQLESTMMTLETWARKVREKV